MHEVKFRALRARALREDVADATSAVEELQQALGEDLPGAYLAILRDYRGPIVFDEPVAFRPVESTPLDRKDGTQGLEVLYGLGTSDNSILAASETYRGRLPAAFLAIGEAPGGNQICLALSGPRTGQVFFWDHDHERTITGQPDNDFANIYQIADSIEDFVGRLSVHTAQPDQGGIIESESWLDV